MCVCAHDEEVVIMPHTLSLSLSLSHTHTHTYTRTHNHAVGPPDPWVYDNLSSSSTMLEAVSKLIEVVPTVSELESHASRGVTSPRVSVPHIHHRTKPTSMIEMEFSKKGLWLLSYYCTPTTAVRVRSHDSQVDVDNPNTLKGVY